MVSPGGGPVDGMPSGAVADPHQSADLREGFVNAYNIVTTVSASRLACCL